MSFKEQFSKHLPEVPENYEASLDEFTKALNDPEVWLGRTTTTISMALDAIAGNMTFLQWETSVRLPREEQLERCIEIAVLAIVATNEPSKWAVTSQDVISKLLSAKNHDYGHAYAKFGSWGILIRCWDKWLRVVNLLDSKDGGPRVGEAIEDTLQDLAGYAALLYVCLRNETIKFERGY